MSNDEKKLLAQIRELTRQLHVEREKPKKKRNQAPAKQRLMIVTVRLPVDLERVEAREGEEAGQPVWRVQCDSSYEGGVDPRSLPFGGSFFALTGEAHEFSGMRSLTSDYDVNFIGAPTLRDRNGDLCDGNLLHVVEDIAGMRKCLANMQSSDSSKCTAVFLTDTDETKHEEGYVSEVTTMDAVSPF